MNLHDAFLETVYDLAAADMDDDAIDLIFESVNNLLIAERWRTCNELFAEIDISRLPHVLMVAFLTATLGAAEKLSSRPKYSRNVRTLIKHIRGENVAERLLGGIQ